MVDDATGRIFACFSEQETIKAAMLLSCGWIERWRVERMNGILKDRLVKERRLRGIGTIEQANLFLHNEYRQIFNEKFTVMLANMEYWKTQVIRRGIGTYPQTKSCTVCYVEIVAVLLEIRR